MRYTPVSIVVLCFVLSCQLTQCAKFVMFMAQTRSHVFPFLSIANELEKYNHSVTFVLSTSMKNKIESEGINVEYIIAKSLEDPVFVESIAALLERKMTNAGFMPLINLAKAANGQCHNFTTDQELYEKLKKEQFDYAMVDFTPVLCFEVLAYKLSLPFVFVGAHIDLIMHRSPFNPSFMPAFFTRFTDRMSFLERVVNTLLSILQVAKPHMPVYENLVEKYVPEKPFLSNLQLKQSALLYIINSDILMDFVLPVPPNIILCGGLGAVPAKPLPMHINKFMQSSKEVVVISFGSIINKFPKEILNKFVNIFQKMKHISFVFGLGDVEKEMENVLFLPWLPQNDLLGHPKTKLFITHCGKNGIFEALYHGIPMIGFPMGLDQATNAAILEDKGYGLSLDILTFSVDELEDKIKTVGFTGHYRENIEQASEIFHRRPQMPAQRAAYWIDLVIRYGTKYFRPVSLDMPWYSFYMLDVYLFFIIMLSIVLYVVMITCKTCCICCKTKHSKEKVE